MPEPPEPSIYQLRAVLLGISPIIWRRLLVRGDSTIADLHVTLQTAFGWSDDHLHRFLIHGKQYGVAYLEGITFRDDPWGLMFGCLQHLAEEPFGGPRVSFCAELKVNRLACGIHRAVEVIPFPFDFDVGFIDSVGVIGRPQVRA